MAGTIESCLGLNEVEVTCNCEKRLQDFPPHWIPDCDQKIHPLTHCMESVSRVATNYKGHSFLTRHLLFGIPGYLYNNKTDLVRAHLELAAGDLASLFNNGVMVNGRRYYAALVGCKGDLKFQAGVVAHMTRSYMNLGRVRPIPCCSLCMAGTREFPMEDVQHEPPWSQSMFRERPWNEHGLQPPFLQVPFDLSRAELLYRLDAFHVFKVGVGRDIVGSSLLWLCYLGVFDCDGEPKNVDSRLSRAHSWFTLYCKAEKKQPGLRSFTKSYFNAPTSADSAWTNSKGSDTMLLLHFLEWTLAMQLRDINGSSLAEHESMLQLLRDVVSNALEMCEVGYKHSLWLSRVCGQRQYCNIMVVVRGYKRLAQYFVEMGVAGFRLKPKLHALHHLAFFLRDELKTPAPKVLNWVCWACEMNEDHIGHTARMSRRLATKTLSLRLMQRYFLKVKALQRRHFQKRRATAKKWARRLSNLF